MPASSQRTADSSFTASVLPRMVHASPSLSRPVASQAATLSASKFHTSSFILFLGLAMSAPSLSLFLHHQSFWSGRKSDRELLQQPTNPPLACCVRQLVQQLSMQCRMVLTW